MTELTTGPLALHWWDLRFWPDIERQDAEWAQCRSSEGRNNFESEVEHMIRESIPQDLESLRLAYGRCNWSNPQVHASSDLHAAVVVASMDEHFTADDVITKLYGDIPQNPLECATDEVGDIELIGTPGHIHPVLLTFPKESLESFVKEVKHVARRAVNSFVTKEAKFLRSLPRAVEQLLREELVQVATVILMDVLPQENGEGGYPG